MSKLITALALLLLGPDTVHSTDSYPAEKFNTLCVSYVEPFCLEDSGVYHLSKDKDGRTILNVIFLTNGEEDQTMPKKRQVSSPAHQRRGIDMIMF